MATSQCTIFFFRYLRENSTLCYELLGWKEHARGSLKYVGFIYQRTYEAHFRGHR